MKIVLFGASGQLGYEVSTRAYDLNFELSAPVQSEVDITDREPVHRLVQGLRPEVIINCAAYTAVDKAEEDKDAAYQLNEEGARHVAEAARENGARLIHISTDYVFGDGFNSPIPEEAPTHPLNVYGASKLAGERAVLQTLGDRGLVLRTSSLHGQKGVNFVHTMLKLFAERETVSVVADQFMSPTWAGWLAEVILDLCRMPVGGVVHASGQGVVSWHEFASEIYRLTANRFPRPVTVQKTTAEQFKRPARRAAYSAMSTDKLTRLLGRAPISWQEGLRRHLEEIGMLG